jgi:hypothetical protein
VVGCDTTNYARRGIVMKGKGGGGGEREREGRKRREREREREEEVVTKRCK